MIFKGKGEERDITRAIVRNFYEEFEELISRDVIVVGGGPSGLIASKKLAERGVRTLIIERNNYLGGGFWIGGYFMTKFTIRAPAHEELLKIGVRLKEVEDGLFVGDAPEACSKLIASVYDAGVKLLTLTTLEDVVLKDGKVCGVLINRSPITYLPREISALDPVPLESKIVIDATGHDAQVVRKLSERGLLDIKGEMPLWIERSEEEVVKRTGEVFPGLIVVGMAVGTVFGLPRMGPTFGSMLLSGLKGAEISLSVLER